MDYSSRYLGMARLPNINMGLFVCLFLFIFTNQDIPMTLVNANQLKKILAEPGTLHSSPAAYIFLEPIESQKAWYGLLCVSCSLLESIFRLYLNTEPQQCHQLK